MHVTVQRPPKRLPTLGTCLYANLCSLNKTGRFEVSFHWCCVSPLFGLNAGELFVARLCFSLSDFMFAEFFMQILPFIIVFFTYSAT